MPGGVRRFSCAAADGIWAAALSRDGKHLATAADWTVRVWDTATGKLQSESKEKGVARSLAFSPDGSRLAIGMEDRRVLLLDVITGQLIGQDAQDGAVWAVAFSPDGKTLASATLSGAIKLWNMTPPAESLTIPIARLHCGQFSRDGKTILVGNGDLTRIIDFASGQDGGSLPAADVRAISADATRLASRTSNFEYAIWDVPSNRKVADVTLPQECDEPPQVRLSRDGKWLAAFTSWWGNINTVTIWELGTGRSKVLKTAPPESNRLSVLCAEFSPDGKLLAAGFQFQWVTVWDIATGEVKLQFSQKPSMMKVYSLAFSPSGQTLAVGTDGGDVTLWSLESGKRLLDFRGDTSHILAMAFAPDGRTLATAGEGKTVRIWDVITGQERCALSGHTAAIKGLLFSPDGYTLGTASYDGTFRIWHAATDSVALTPRATPSLGAILAPQTHPTGALEMTEAGLRESVGHWPQKTDLHRQLGGLLVSKAQFAEASAILPADQSLQPGPQLKRVKESDPD